jgi:dienelactone hydrolase
MTQQPEYNTLSYLDRVYYQTKQSLPFEARTVEDWRKWRRALKGRLKSLLGGFPERGPLNARTVEKIDCGDYWREKVIFDAEPGTSIPAYFLLPKDAKGPIPGVLALHGHGYGKDEIVDIDRGSEEIRRHIDEVNYAYAVEMVREGYAVLAPDLRCFGERDNAGGCLKACINAMMLGKNVIALRVSDSMQCVDYLRSRPEVIDNRIACLGISGGGLATLYSAIYEPRFKVAVISGYFCAFKESVIDQHHCMCNYIPNILQYAELPDLTALIAPMPLLIQNGELDPIFPIEAVRREFPKVQAAYKAAGVPDKVAMDIIPQCGHAWRGEKPKEWLKRWL